MILAAAAVITDKAPPPPELELAWQCRDYPGALPEAGALLDQPAALLARMRWALRVWSIFDDFHRAKSWAKWQKANPEAWKLKTKIDKLKAAHDRTHAAPDN